ncbi:hypothetical protein I3271_05365 [Photobacterium leiognathi]|uniref:hypothetical protein n=1 Tax=Photobacterium leiognathi TaxID=553611 RepID=UPI001EE01733|nr:hypothetical protein [Photobacterium leiognathi]MCG3884109.1 hypothetical protein [Photobacterium leiognathi]
MSLLSFLFSDKRKEADSIIDSVGDTCDKLFTSDEERKEMQVKLERLSALNKSTFVAGGRSAILYAVALVFMYQAIGRDVLGIIYGFEHLPPPALDVTKYVGHIFTLLMGA